MRNGVGTESADGPLFADNAALWCGRVCRPDWVAVVGIRWPISRQRRICVCGLFWGDINCKRWLISKRTQFFHFSKRCRYSIWPWRYTLDQRGHVFLIFSEKSNYRNLLISGNLNFIDNITVFSLIIQYIVVREQYFDLKFISSSYVFPIEQNPNLWT